MAIVTDRVRGSLIVEADFVRYPYVYTCSQEGCYYSVTVRTIDEGYIQHAIHKHRKNGVIDMSLSAKSLLEALWDKIDAEVKSIMEAAEERREYHKARASGIAEAIALMHSPYFETTEEVSREALVRYRAFSAGEQYETPGLGIRRNELPPGYRVGLHAARTRDAETRPQAPRAEAIAEAHGMIGVDSGAKYERRSDGSTRVVAPRTPIKTKPPMGKLTPEQRATIRERAAAGFSVEMLAVAFDESELVIKRAIAEEVD